VPSADNRCQTMTNPLPRKGFCFAPKNYPEGGMRAIQCHPVPPNGKS